MGKTPLPQGKKKEKYRMLRMKGCMKTNVTMSLLQQGTARQGQGQQGRQNTCPHPYGCFLPIGANWNA